MCLFKRNKSSLNNKNITSTFAEGSCNESETVFVTVFSLLWERIISSVVKALVYKEEISDQVIKDLKHQVSILSTRREQNRNPRFTVHSSRFTSKNPHLFTQKRFRGVVC